MDFSNRIKSGVTQVLLRALLNDAGYRLVPLGVEEVIREAQALSSEQYREMDMPKPLRTLPDFFVANGEMTKSWLVEVKYRSRWNDQVRNHMEELLRDQVSLWNPLYLVIFLGEKARDNNTPKSSLGICRLVLENDELFILQSKGDNDLVGQRSSVHRLIPWQSVDWGHMSRIQDVFDGLGERFEDETLKKAVSVMRCFGEIEG